MTTSARLLSKPEVLDRLGGITFPTLWLWMQRGKFPRARVVGDRPMWVESEINEWIQACPPVRYKRDTDGVAIRNAPR